MKCNFFCFCLRIREGFTLTELKKGGFAVTIGIQIRNQQITTEKTRCIVANSVNFVSAVCSFDEEWQGCAKHVVFTNGDISKTVTVSDGEKFAVPYEVLVPGRLEISAVGYGEKGEMRITTRKMQIPLMVYASGDIKGGESSGYTPELWEKISAMVGDVDTLEVDAKTLVDAVNLIAKAENADGIVLQKDDSGFFATEEENDGDTVFYLHDKADLEKSQNVMKLSANILSFSRDGGETFSCVLSADGEVSDALAAAFEEHGENFENPHKVTAEQVGAAAETRRINGHSLESDVYITAADVGAVSQGRKINGKTLETDITLGAADVGAIPATRKINGKALDEDITLTASDVGAEVSGSFSEKLGAHNADEQAHGDIRVVLTKLQERINAISDSDDVTLDQLSEIVSYIKDNKSVIEAVTTGKVSVSDIVNDLDTSAADRPLSAAQGRALKILGDEHAGNAENPHNVTAQQTGAAPAGYGLGGAQRITADKLDSTTAPGWYYMSESEEVTLGGASTKYWRVIVDAYGTGTQHCRQTAVTPNGKAILRRICSGGQWGEWEHEEPNMTAGTEYRTTERWNGKAVYTKLIDFGAMPNGTTKSLDIGINAENIVRCSEKVLSPSGYGIPLPYFLADGTLQAKYQFYGTKIQVYTAADYSAGSAQFRIWYIKD